MRSGASSMVSARCPYAVATSSADGTSRLSHTCPPAVPDAVPPTPGCHVAPSPIAALPRRIYGLKPSKLPTMAKVISPPFGACGFTYGK